jgi:hypothetical protein
MFVVGNVMKRQEMFAAAGPKSKVSITFQDMAQGAAYWFIVLDFLEV